MRIIDSDMLYEKIERRYRTSKGEVRQAYAQMLDDITCFECLDATKVVFCKDCKLYDNECQWCFGPFEDNIGPDNYCSYGERRIDPNA